MTLRFVDKRGFDTISVMGVQIDVKHPVSPLTQKSHDGVDGIVEVAESTRPVRPPMVCASGRMKNHMPLASKFRGQNGPANGHGCPLEQTVKQRVFESPDMVSLSYVRRYLTCGLCVLQGFNVAPIMKLEKLVDRCRLARAEGIFVKPAQYSDKIENGGVTHDFQWMVIAKCGATIDVTANVQRSGQIPAPWTAV